MSTGISEEFSTAAKQLSPAALKLLEEVRKDAAPGATDASLGKYDKAAALVNELSGGKAEITADNIRGYASQARFPGGQGLLATGIQIKANKGRTDKVTITAQEVEFFKELHVDRTANLISLMSRVSGEKPADLVKRINTLAEKGSTPAPASTPASAAPAAPAAPTALATPPPSSIPAGSNGSIGPDSSLSQSTFKPAAHNPALDAAARARAEQERAQAEAATRAKAEAERTQAEAAARVKAETAAKERAEKGAQERAQVAEIMGRLNQRKTKEAGQTGGLLSLAIGQFADTDFDKALNSPGMAEARKRGAKVAEGGMGLMQMASLFTGRGPISVPISMVDSIRDRMITEFKKDPLSAINKLMDIADADDKSNLELVKGALTMIKSNPNADSKQLASTLSDSTGRVISETHINNLKLALSTNPKDKEKLTNDKLLETLLSFDPSINQKMDDHASLIGAGMMKEYLGNPGMLIDKIVGTLKEFIPGFGQFFEMAGNALKSVANTVVGAFTPKA